MKKMWKKNNKAVSPVIATILMVAITVVLAAVLYVMVMGFGGSGTTSAPTASLTPNGNRLVLSLSDSYTIVGSGSTIWYTVGTTKCYFNGTAPTGFAFVDAGGDGRVSTGDYFTNTGTDATLKIVWSSGGTNQVIAEGII